MATMEKLFNSYSRHMTYQDEQFTVKKTKQSKTIHVQAHDRLMYLRRFKFICGYCNEVVTRETYASMCPKYGNVCKGSKKGCRRFAKKK